MSKYVNKPHGLVIGSDNIFFIVGDGEMRSDYRAIVSSYDYQLDNIDSLTVQVRTPAQQIIWTRVDGTEDTDFRHHYLLTRWCRGWLDQNVGAERDAWDVRSKSERTTEPIFFRRRTDALAFVRQIDDRLKGIRIEK
jgi:hypothetical protein